MLPLSNVLDKLYPTTLVQLPQSPLDRLLGKLCPGLGGHHDHGDAERLQTDQLRNGGDSETHL